MKQWTSQRANSIEYSGIRRMVTMAAGMKDVISFALGEPDYDTPMNIRQAAIKAIEEGFTHYTSTAGLPELREAVAEKLRTENGVSYDPQTEIIITVGACEACYSAVMSTIDPGDEVIITDPSFVFYTPSVILAGGKPVLVPTKEKNDFRPNLDEMEGLITPKTKMLWINSPNNPTGSILLQNDIKRIADIAKKHDLLVMTDEVYEKFIYDGYKHYNISTLPGMKDRTIVVNALSKTYAMTGWRVGYVAANEKLINRIHLVHMHICTHPSIIAQKASVEALRGPQDSVSEMVREFDSRRKFIIKRLNEIEGISCWNPKGSFYAFPNITQLGKGSYELAEYLLKEGRINTVPGAAFGKHGEGYLRISFASKMKNIEEGMSRLEKTVKKLRC
jgi:aminotransferase